MPNIAPIESRQLFAAFVEAFADYAMDTSGATEEKLLLRMRKNAVDFEASPGLYDDGRLVGFTAIGIDRWGDRMVAFDAATGLAPDYRKQGWASKLFEHAVPALRERGVERFALEVLQQNEPAIKAYEKSGFEIARELKCLAASVDDLKALKAPSAVGIRLADRDALRALEASASFLPSFENRFTAVDAIPEDVVIEGAYLDGALAGVSAYSPCLNWLLTLLVSPEYRRRGIGAALLHSVTSHIPEGTKKLAALNVDGDDEGMQRFFCTCGFEPLVDQYEMRRDL